MACCPHVLQFLKAIGATHAAAMHTGNANPDAWTNADWRAHFDEEERLLFPLMRVEHQDALVGRLAAEHRQYEAEMKVYGHIVSARSLTAHSDAEDQFILDWIRLHGGPRPRQ